MAWSVSPRNSTSAGTENAGTTSITTTLSPTSTVAGDLGVVAVIRVHRRRHVTVVRR